ncbi:hypothetical protein ACFZDJ_52710 [Streptomyces sp. NPDC007896]|uniref:hypothetical protein n=1 Tax=Streptomyces sp. NPDC007896 TaxID=3364784 RepID=UPI0036E7EA8C
MRLGSTAHPIADHHLLDDNCHGAGHEDGSAPASVGRTNGSILSLPDDWIAVYKPVRSHNEGIHGRLKSDALDIGNPKHRRARGQVVRTLLVALMVTAGNDILETWLYQRTGTQLTDTDYADTAPQQPAQPEKAPLAGIGRPPDFCWPHAQ